MEKKCFIPLFLPCILILNGAGRSFLIKHIDLDQYISSHYVIGAMDLRHTHFESYLPEDYWHLAYGSYKCGEYLGYGETKYN